MTEKVMIETLPITAEFLPEKRLVQQRGELALIVDGMEFRHLTYFSLKKGKGLYRGGHYHLKKTEHFYVVSGKLEIALVDIDSGEKSQVEVEAGQRITMSPKWAHRFKAKEDAQVIEYYDMAYDRDDDIPYHDF